MLHPLVIQLHFTRNEFKRSLKGLTEEDARKRFLPMNCISWNIGHLAWQEQRYFIYYGQGKLVLPEINSVYVYGAPASDPGLKEILRTWRMITRVADECLDNLTSEKLKEHVIRNGKVTTYIFGSLLQRLIYHYWYHIGENMAIRQNLKQTNLPEFVGNIDKQAPYVTG
jgi:hypothetical protein